MPEFNDFAVERLPPEQFEVGREAFDVVCGLHSVPRQDRAFRSMRAELIVRLVEKGSNTGATIEAAHRFAEVRYPTAGGRQAHLTTPWGSRRYVK